MANRNNLKISFDEDKEIDMEIRNSFPGSIYVMCIHHILNLGPRNEAYEGIIQRRRTIYTRKGENVNEEKEKLKKYPVTFRKIEHLDDEQSDFYAAPKIIFDRLSAQLAECFSH